MKTLLGIARAYGVNLQYKTSNKEDKVCDNNYRERFREGEI